MAALPAINMVCPHCGHDGTRETSRAPLGSYGFNCLTEGLISREVSGYDEAGRLRLSGECSWQPVEGAGAKLECRACWRTFQLPEGSPILATIGEMLLPTAAPASAIPANSARSAALESGVSGLAQAIKELETLRTEVNVLRERMAAPGRPPAEPSHRPSFSADAERGVLEKIEQLRETLVRQAEDTRERADALESAYREAAQARNWLGEVTAQLEVGQKAIGQRLDAHADVIRGLHAAAQEQRIREQQLQAAVQRLEEKVAGLGRGGSLPKNL